MECMECETRAAHTKRRACIRDVYVHEPCMCDAVAVDD